MTRRSELLAILTAAVRAGTPISFVKRGDGEEFCMAGERGENCDGHPYSAELGAALKEAFAFLEKRPDVFVAPWCDQERYQVLLHIVGVDIGATVAFWKAVGESARPKVFVGPARLEGAARMLGADHVVVPLQNAFSRYEAIRGELLARAKPRVIFVFCAGMPAKAWIAEVLQACRGASCIDAGSAFDPLFAGNTRTGQLDERARELYA